MSKTTGLKHRTGKATGNISPITVDIHDIGHSGEGVGKYQGFTVFVPGAVPGDTVVVRPVSQQPRYMHAEMLELLKPAPTRTEPRCPVFSQCGGCQLQHVSYTAQVEWKEERVRQVLARLGKVAAPRVLPLISAHQPWDYRNKAQFPVGIVDGRITLGFYEQKSHQLVPAEHCLVQHPRIRTAAPIIAGLLNDSRIMPYQEETGKGIIRHVLCRVSFHTNELLVTLVTTRGEFPELDRLVQGLVSELAPLAGITINVNTEKGNRILGPHNRVVYGRGVLNEVLRIGDLSVAFHVSAPSFFQVNPVQAQELFAAALKYADIHSDTSVLDAYCGTGSIALFLAKAGAKQVWGIEEIVEAVDDARVNAQLNGVTNATFIPGRVEMVATNLFAKEGAPDVLVVDPPRAGLEHSFIDTAVTWQPRRWVYVSCNPATLARDIEILAQQGYALQEVQPVDMFPHTAHIECVALLTRGSQHSD